MVLEKLKSFKKCQQFKTDILVHDGLFQIMKLSCLKKHSKHTFSSGSKVQLWVTGLRPTVPYTPTVGINTSMKGNNQPTASNPILK